MNDDRRRNGNRRNFNHDRRYGNPKVSLLPSPAVLESYEEISPGLINKLADLAKHEQKHRHEWENRYLRAMTLTSRIGQFFGFALCIIIIYVTIIFAKNESKLLAIIMCVSGFSFLICATLASIKSRRITRRNNHPAHRNQGRK